MVLVRLRYFRAHIIQRHREKTVRQSMRDRVAGLVAGVGRRAVPLWHPEVGASEKHAQHGSHGIQASDGIGVALAGGATTGVGLGIALGTGDSDEGGQDANAKEPKLTQSRSNSYIQIDVESPLRVSPSEDPTMYTGESGERGIIADAQSFTSSPRSGAIPLPQSPTSMGSGRVQWGAPYMQSIGDVGTVRRRPGQALCISSRARLLTLSLQVCPCHVAAPSSFHRSSMTCLQAKHH